MDTGQVIKEREVKNMRLFIYLYLSDDLSIFSVDLSDASPLCQEGEDIIELEDKDTVKNYSGTAFIFKTPPGCLYKYQTLLFIPRGHPQATI